MQHKKNLENALQPFIYIAHCYRCGDVTLIDKYLPICLMFINKYKVAFTNLDLLSEILININLANKNEDHIAVADYFEYDLCEYLQAQFDSMLITLDETDTPQN